MWRWVVERFEKEWPLIQAAPLSATLILLLFLGFAWSLCSWIYGERLSSKDDLIKDYREKLGIHATAKSPYSSMRNRELSVVASSLAVNIRELAKKYNEHMAPDETEAQQNRSLVDILGRYESQYKVETILLHDEMYSRLGKQASSLEKPEMRWLMLYPGNGLGLGMIADDLQLLGMHLSANQR